MRKSVMKSMIFGSLTVMLVSFLVVTLVFFYSIKSDVIDESYAEIDETIGKIEPIVSASMDYSTGKMFDFFDITMHQLTDTEKYNIIICTEESDVVWTAGIDYKYSHISAYAMKLIVLLGDRDFVHTSDSSGTFYNVSTITSVHRVYNSMGDKIRIIICSLPAPDLLSGYVNLLWEVSLMELVALVFMAVFLYLFSRNITSPLRKINNAVKEFSNGNFDKRVEYTSGNELGELADNINSMASSIQNLEKMRTGFISDVSHELRTPMTTISGFIEGILDGTISEADRNKYLEIVLSETRRLSRLVNDLLGISRLDKNSQPIQKKEFDICELSKLAILKFEREIDEKRIEVIFETDNEEVYVNADNDSITRVLINLIHNAVKFTDNGGYIKISIYEDNNKCFVAVENDGPGISPEKLDFIWQRFYKTDESRSNDISGVGLGLYIVKRIIDAHGESISVASDPDKFTRFVFSLELAN